MDPLAIPRPHVRSFDVVTTLADFAIVTYHVSPDALRRHLPAGIEPDVRRLDDGSDVAMMSAVPFRDRDFRFGIAQWARFRMGQTNYRAYVLREGKRCAWFFGTSLTRPFVWIPRALWQLPWHAAEMSFDTRWQSDQLAHYRLTTSSSWGACELELTGTNAPMGRLDGFSDEEETALVLTHPLVGYFYRLDGAVASYRVWHQRLQLLRASCIRARFQVFEDLGLINARSTPSSVLVQRATEFIIVLPPRRI